MNVNGPFAHAVGSEQLLRCYLRAGELTQLAGLVRGAGAAAVVAFVTSEMMQLPQSLCSACFLPRCLLRMPCYVSFRRLLAPHANVSSKTCHPPPLASPLAGGRRSSIT